MATNGLIVSVAVRMSDRAASLDPLYEAVHDSRPAYRRIDDPRAEFPDRGRLVWFDPPREAREGTFWRVDFTDCKTYRTAEAHVDAFMIVPGSSPQPLSDILDLRYIGDEEDVRRQITGDGITLPMPPSDSVFLWVDPRRFVGPVRLEQADASQRWRLTNAGAADPIACWEGEEADILRGTTGAQQRAFAASVRAWRKIGLTDWNPDDSKILVRTLNELRRLDPTFAKEMVLTTKSIDRLGSVLASATVPDRALHEQRVRRLQGLLPQLQEAGRIDESVVEALLELSTVQASLAARRVEIEREVKAELVERVKADMAREHEELDRLRIEKAAAIHTRDAARAEIESEARRLEDTVGSYEQALTERIGRIGANPERFLADMVLLRAGLGLANDERAPMAPTVITPSATEPSAMKLTDTQQLVSVLEAGFQAAGLPGALWRLLHASFLTRAVPAVTGGRGLDALQTYAHCLTAGRALRVAVSPGVQSPRDLLDQPVLGREEATLSELVRHMGRSGSVELILLENVNTCPVDTVLLPILRAQRRGEGPVPPNVLMAASLSEGAVRLPLSQGVWEFLTLVEVTTLPTVRGPLTHPDKRQSPLPPSVLGTANWQALQASASDGPIGRCAQVLGRLPESLGLDSSVQDQALRLFAALMASGAEEGVALEVALLAVVAPSVVDQAATFTAALAEQGLTLERLPAVLRRAGLLTG